MNAMENIAKKKHPQYWQGINDALELLDTYIVWYEDHPESRTPREYIGAAKKAVARHCKSCLRELLAIPFNKVEE